MLGGAILISIWWEESCCLARLLVRDSALAAEVRRTKSPEPHIAAVNTKDGDTLYAVRIGSFRSRAEAEALLKRLARKDLAVGAL